MAVVVAVAAVVVYEAVVGLAEDYMGVAATDVVV